jgi:hypothetical protein
MYNIISDLIKVNPDEIRLMLLYYSELSYDVNIIVNADVLTQRGFIANYLEDKHNIGMLIDKYNAMFFFVIWDKTEESSRYVIKHQSDVFMELSFENFDNNTIVDNYKIAMIKLFTYLKTPF